MTSDVWISQREENQKEIARSYLRRMLESDEPVAALTESVGCWDKACQTLYAVHTGGGCKAARKVFMALCDDDPDLMTLVSAAKPTFVKPYTAISSLIAKGPPIPITESPLTSIVGNSLAASPSLQEVQQDDVLCTSLSFKPLPPDARVEEGLGDSASPWLNAYIDFSRLWSPRGYDGFHEAVGLWVLSTVAARRVMLPMGDKYYTPLLIALVGRTGLFAKSTTAKIGRSVLKSAGLDWFLAPDEATPQKFISEMAGHIAGNYNKMPDHEKKEYRLKLAFSGQHGWFYDEFGQIIASIIRDSVMSDFRGIMRRLDDCYDCYKYATISRGTNVVENPYLALLGSMTPDDLGKAAKSGSSLWGDGFLARFAFVTPPAGTSSLGRFPPGLREVPEALWMPLRAWHEHLGIPELEMIELMDKNDKATGSYSFRRGALPEQICTPGEGVIEAFYTYSDALTILRTSTNTQRDLDGNYNRFASKALRIAMLLASLENEGQIEMCHWARGQSISERWRANVHDLFAQANEANADESELMEEKILQVVEKLKLATIREIKQQIRGIDTPGLRVKVSELAQARMLKAVTFEKTVRYCIPDSN